MRSLKQFVLLHTPKEAKDAGVCLPRVGRVVCENCFSQVFAFTLVIKITWTKKNYPAMDLPVYGESDGTNFILVED